jgi:phage terminase Nu1 subunit (DNA packaging protein)
MSEVSRKELGAILGIGTRQVANLEEQGMPHRAGGQRKFYPLAECVSWVRARDVDAAVAAVTPTDFQESRAREMKAKAEKAELEVAVMRRELIHVDDLEGLHARPLAQLRAGLLALAGRIVAELPLPPVEALEIIEPIVHEFMSELSEDPDDDDEVDDAA